MAIPRNLIRHCIFLTVLSGLLAACGTTNEISEGEIEVPAARAGSIEALLDLAARSQQPRASEYIIAASEQLLQENRATQARDIVSQVAPANTLPFSLRVRLAVVLAELSLEDNDPIEALSWLEGELVERVEQQQPALRRRVAETRGRALLADQQFQEAAMRLIGLNEVYPTSEAQQFNDLIWQAIQNLSGQQLTQLADNADSYELRGWVELARAMRTEQHNIAGQINGIARWRSVWNQHSASDLLPTQLMNLDEIWDRRPRHIALLLPLQSQIGRAVQDGFLSAYYQAMEMSVEVPQISVYDTSGVTEIQGLYETAVESGAELVIGPLNKQLVQQLDNLSTLPVPTLALNYTDFATRNSEHFYQFGLSPEDEIRQTAIRAWRTGYRNAAIITPESADYARLQQAFNRIWQELGGNVVSSTRFSDEGEYADAIKQLLAIDASEDRAARLESLLPRNSIEFTPTRRGDIDFIFLMATPRQGRQINPTLAFYFAEDIPVYALSTIYDGSQNPLTNQDLNGIVFTVEPWIMNQESALKNAVDQHLQATQGALQRLRALGIDSFRIYPRLAQFASGELTSFKGATGALTMNDSGIIERTPLTAVFVDGSAVLADSPEPIALN